MTPEILVASPNYSTTVRPEAYRAVYTQGCRQRAVRFSSCRCSLLAFGFNQLLCDALNHGIRYFAMVHADVQPDTLWLDTLMDEMHLTGADVLSAVLPMKGEDGLTSTAIDDPANPWEPWCRLTMREVLRLPETFDAAAAGHPGRALLVNTGLMLVRLGSWASEFPGFTVRDRIVKHEDGRWEAQVEPEDWGFSRWCHARGLRVLATRKVKAIHWGDERPYTNWEPWGTASTDPGCGRARATLPKPPAS